MPFPSLLGIPFYSITDRFSDLLNSIYDFIAGTDIVPICQSVFVVSICIYVLKKLLYV